MGRSTRGKGELFRYKDFIYEIADVLVVCAVAMSRPRGPTDPGRGLSDILKLLEDSLSRADELNNEITRRPQNEERTTAHQLDLARLHPVLQGLATEDGSSWLQKRNRRYFPGKWYSDEKLANELIRFRETLLEICKYLGSTADALKKEGPHNG